MRKIFTLLLTKYALVSVIFIYVPSQAQLTLIDHPLYVSDISEDGNTAVLYTISENYVWTKTGGLKQINAITTGGGNSGKPSITADGKLIAFTATNPTTLKNEMSIYDVATETITNLGGLQNSSQSNQSSAYEISKEGKTVVGLGFLNAAWAHAIRWTEEKGIIDLGAIINSQNSRANSVSSNGEVIAGWQEDEYNHWQGTIWKNNQIIALSRPDGEPISEINAISGNGKWAVGDEFLSPWRWSEETGQLFLFTNTDPTTTWKTTAISEDGKIIVGYQQIRNLAPIHGRGFIWTEQLGVMDLAAFANSIGIATDGLHLSFPLNISLNGEHIVGLATTDTGVQKAFMLSIGQLKTTEANKAVFSIYPNPVQNFLTIQSELPITSVEIYTATGQLITAPIDLNQKIIQVSHLTKGVYFLNLWSNNHKSTYKFIKN